MAPNPAPSEVTRKSTDPEGYEFIDGFPVIGGTVCSFTVEDFNPSLGGEIVWENCCNENDIKSCSIQFPKQKKCMTGYFSCGDVTKHPAMCSTDTSGYSEKIKQSMDRKCCPGGYTCGSSWDAPCQKILGPFDAPKVELENRFTNPQYASSPGVFHACDRNQISASTIGGITGAGIITFCILVTVVLYFVRRRIYRDPRRLARRRMISKMIDEHLRSPGSSMSDAAIKQKGVFFEEPPETPVPAHLRRSESRIHRMAGITEPPLPSQRGFEGITVTKEITVQTIEEGNEMKPVPTKINNNDSEDSISSVQAAPVRKLDPSGETWFEVEQEKQAKRAKLFSNQRF